MTDAVVDEEPTKLRLDGGNGTAKFALFPLLNTCESNRTVLLRLVVLPELFLEEILDVIEVVDLDVGLEAVNVCDLAVDTLGEEECVLIKLLSGNDTDLLDLGEIVVSGSESNTRLLAVPRGVGDVVLAVETEDSGILKTLLLPLMSTLENRNVVIAEEFAFRSDLCVSDVVLQILGTVALTGLGNLCPTVEKMNGVADLQRAGVELSVKLVNGV